MSKHLDNSTTVP